MRVYVSVDIDGVAGVVHVDQSRRTGHDYERARRWMTAETNAAVLGAYDAGATSVLVNDSQGDWLLRVSRERAARSRCGAQPPR